MQVEEEAQDWDMRDGTAALLRQEKTRKAAPHQASPALAPLPRALSSMLPLPLEAGHLEVLEPHPPAHSLPRKQVDNPSFRSFQMGLLMPWVCPV